MAKSSRKVSNKRPDEQRQDTPDPQRQGERIPVIQSEAAGKTSNVGCLLGLSAPLYKTMFMMFPAGIIFLDSQGVIAEANVAAMELFDDPLAGKAWCDLISDAFAPRNDDGHEITLRNGKRVHMATRSLHPEPGQLIVITDLTETRAWQEQRTQEERLSTMGQMLAQLAHQVRTPIASAVLYAANLKKFINGDERQQNYIEKISTQLHTLEKQIDDMLLFAQGGNSVLKRTSVEHLMSNVMDVVKDDVARAHSLVFVNNQVGSLPIFCNIESIIGALRNCIDNALQATRQNARVTLVAKITQEDSIDLIVVDDGPGMSNDIQSKVLQPFFTTKTKGTGLGLAVVDAVAKAHQGSVWLESKPGIGTQVGLRLPLTVKERE
jgi:two-component system, sensor histidine kinase FlrB